MQQTLQQIQAEVSQCYMFLQLAAERLTHITALLQQMQGAGTGNSPDQTNPGKNSGSDIPNSANLGTSRGSDIPNLTDAGTSPIRDIPNSVNLGISRPHNFPPQQTGEYPGRNSFPAEFKVGMSPEGDAAILAHLHTILKERVFTHKVSYNHVRRAALVLLNLVRSPGAHGLDHYATLTGLTYSGVGKFMMELRQRKLIVHNGRYAHIPTERSQQYLREATALAAS